MGGLIAKAMLGVVSVFAGLIFNIYATLTGAILGMAVMIFNWVVSPGFISLSFTNAGLQSGDPNFNAFVSIGWELTRSFTNIIFVIVLIVIGLGTALRRADYQMQKTLPMLVIIALLINFTPVILGLIIDASNIVMNFFISGGFEGGNSFVNFATRQWSSIGSLVGGAKFWDPTSSNEAIAAAAGSVSLIFFNIIAAILYLVISFLFVVRYIAIWLLVILSPLAFACYILPNTRGYFNQWWKIFIQWTLFGIILGFFLYLSDHFIQIATSGKFLSEEVGQAARTPGLSGIVNNMLPYGASLILLFIGLSLAIASAPQGAAGIMKIGERAARATSTTLARNIAGRTMRTAKSLPPIRAGAEAWRINRGLGRSRRQAFGAAVERAGAAVKLETGWRVKAAVKGAPAAIGKDFKDSAKAGWKTAFGAKKGKKGQLCVKCGNPLKSDAFYCDNCGAKQ